MRSSSQLLLNLVLIAAVAALFFLHFSQRSRIAYVESARVLEGYKAMQVAQATYQQEAAGWQANLDTLKQTVQQELDGYNRVRTSLPLAERAVREASLAKRQQQYFDYKKALGEKATTEEARLTGEVIQKADAFMRRYGKEHGYDIVFAATEAGTVVYGKEGMDITDEVIKAINE
ncbi:OmpH family outer membrane protein [Hymenobacter lucidus]|uniref:OmpH family outer membrane protein n=1 Tax=Hymenobacter lucidus TaxID=2880930 RepID=A0ABS8AZB2_9BACT|nr:OmpH family outer membrane protein [Hymenobacter lucidus]MCB2411151.1 OmpH family outer membrane protein [Hymenobacter lucidus]